MNLNKNLVKNNNRLMKSSSECGMIPHENVHAFRPGCKDIWNAFMVNGATFGEYDIPFCPTTVTHIPDQQFTWEEAKQIHRKHIAKKEYDYFVDALVNFYIDDYKFNGIHGIWHDYKFALEVLRHFSGVITPDFSTNQDFPEALKIYATYQMRAYGYWLGREGLGVINNARWGSEESLKYCFVGIPRNSIVSIGTVGGSPRKLIDRERFETGLFKMVEILQPHTILVYGSAKGKCFNILRDQGIHIISYPSKTAKVYEGRN